MANIIVFLVGAFSFVIVCGAVVFQILPRLFPKIRQKLPAQNVISYIQTVPILFMFASLVFLFLYSYLQSHVGKDAYFTVLGWAHILWVAYDVANVVFNYLCAVLIVPGYPQTQEEFQRERSFIKKYEMCAKCNRIRNFGTHHCSWCHKCVRMMCHHCPFTNNCVGLKNYVYYYSFLGYAFVGMIYACYLGYFPFASCYKYLGASFMSEFLNHGQFDGLHRYTDFKSKISEHVNATEMCQEMGEYIVVLAPVVVITIFMGLLFGFQTLLLLSDLSIVDFYEVMGRSSSVTDFLRSLYVSITKKKKTRFWKLVYAQKSRWWKFFIPSFIDVDVDKLETKMDM
ncbi:putative ZDHHC-type palmitoyltransferase 8 [Exaiptasia diaphana]|uniref:Palmitoyltransferase n=1 Tax=Exaiptasia diaphana TaxID=2652724 RepID=A0A913WQG8_EXADI|nr:putative ZDHHC-type palmitoyltransferase 8 [Exaiptasia diaphana]